MGSLSTMTTDEQIPGSDLDVSEPRSEHHTGWIPGSTNAHTTSNATIKSRSCVVIGSTTLAIFCTERILAAGHDVTSVVATDEVFRTWAAREGIRNEDSVAALEMELSKHPVDWLFSVVNPIILSASLIERVRRGAFNYHDSPLPRYAGSYATSWALLAQETRYAVSWHSMTATVDDGRIAIQQSVSIEPDDTALSLNLKCYQAARQSFSELLLQLGNDSLVTSSQDRSQRSFYPRTRRPEAGACLDWTQSAERLSAIVRALDFGELYPNPLTCTKLILGSDTVRVNQLQNLTQRSEAAPGTLISISSKGWCVATSTADVRISDLANLEGSALDPEAVAQEVGLQPGQQLPILTPEQAREIRGMLERLTPYEIFWHDRLAVIQPIELPYEVAPEKTAPQWVTTDWFEPIPYCGERSPRLTILGAFAIYLARLNGQSRFQIGWSVVSLPVQTTLPAILASTVPMECEIDCECQFEDIVKRMEEEIRLLDRSRTYPRDLVSRYPALRSILELKSAKPWQIAVSIVDNPAREEAVGALLTLQIDSQGQFRWIYDIQRLEPALINRMSGHLRELARTAAANGAARVADLNLLSETERVLLLKTWNDTQTPYPDKTCFHQLFEQQAECTPDAIAVFFEGDVLSHAQLNARANQLAYRLIELDLAPETRVAVCVERSPAMIVSFLAILKAGAVYVPLDPTYQSQRLARILTDADPAVVLADETGRVALGETALHSRCVLDPNSPDRHSQVNPTVPNLTSRNLAYIIYTSGSTGVPKGVTVEHRGLVNLALDHIARFEVGSTSRMLQFASPSFDTSISEIVMALGSGASLYLLPDIVRRDQDRLFNFMQQHLITHVTLPPVLLQSWRDKFKRAKSLTFIFAGEAPKAESLKELHSHNIVNNAYGLTETTVCSIVWHCPSSYTGKTTLTGRPISNTRIYLLDAFGQPVPLGAVGELYIGGDGVARGYLNRPDLTAERFLPNPFEDDPASRLYKTGDLARYLPDGNLVFLGRNDHQFKIRGFRIEPGEIEARLVEHPAVREAVVVAFGPVNKRLIAYVVADQIEPVALREHLRGDLPDYMVPSTFIRLDVFPLTSNGKLDREALPTPDENALAYGTYEPPTGEIERSLAEVWRELLGVERVGRHDSFFALGGHSLLAVEMIKRAIDYGLPASLNELFEHPTLANFAFRMAPAYYRGYNRAVPVRPTGSEQPLFFVPSGFGDHSYVFALTRHIEDKYPVYALPWPWPSMGESFPSDMESLAERMIPFVRAVQPKGPYRIVGYSAGGILAYAIAQSLHRHDAVSFVGLIDVAPPHILRRFSTDHRFFEYLAQYVSVEKFSKILDLANKMDEIDYRNLICDAQRLGLLGTNVSSDFLISAWERIDLFSQAANSYQFQPLPFSVYQFHSAEEFIHKCTDDENILQSDVSASLRKLLPHTRVRSFSIPGDHVTMMTDVIHRSHLGEAFNRALETLLTVDCEIASQNVSVL